jgi:hypothetical protein
LKRSIGNTAVLWTTQEERDFWRLIIFNNMIRVRATSSHQRGVNYFEQQKILTPLERWLSL